MKSEKSSEILKYFNFMWRTMKKLFSIILILIALLQISLTSAFATTSVSFEMQNADMKPNRLFSVALSANSGNRLSAATFEFTYDPDYIEFRKENLLQLCFPEPSCLKVPNRASQFSGAGTLHLQDSEQESELLPGT